MLKKVFFEIIDNNKHEMFQDDNVYYKISFETKQTKENKNKFALNTINENINIEFKSNNINKNINNIKFKNDELKYNYIGILQIESIFKFSIINNVPLEITILNNKLEQIILFTDFLTNMKEIEEKITKLQDCKMNNFVHNLIFK